MDPTSPPPPVSYYDNGGRHPLGPDQLQYHHHQQQQQQQPPEVRTVTAGDRCRICCESCCNCFTKTVAFILSHIGLMALVVGYCVMGAFAFERLESGYELEVKDRMVTQRHEVTDDIWDITNRSKVLNAEIWIGQVTHRMKQFENDLIKAMRYVF